MNVAFVYPLYMPTLRKARINLYYRPINCTFVPKLRLTTILLSAMRYKITKETKPTLSTFGKYKAVAVHNQTIDSEQIYKETARRMGVSAGTISGIMMSMAEVVNDHLRMGDKVRLDEWGLMKLEIESEKVDDPKQFRAKKHIRGVRLHFLPESREGTQALYEGITYEKESF